MKDRYLKLLKHPQWFRKRDEVVKRDGHKCRNCGSGERLSVHHRQYHVCRITGKQKLPWQYDAKHLITLCRKCHDEGHSKFKIPTYKI